MIHGIPWWAVAMWLVCLAAFGFIFLGGGPRVKIGRRDNHGVAEPPLLCPGCTLVIGEDVCKHLREHETRLPNLVMYSDDQGERERARALLTEVVRTHGNRKWVGQCVCWSETPGLRA